MERAHRGFHKALDGEERTDFLQAEKVIAEMIRWLNDERLRGALDFLRPIEQYGGDTEALGQARWRELTQARHRRR
jgi:hypothetical protein